MELAEVLSVIIIVQALDIMVEPYLSSSQRADAVALESYALDIEFGEQVAHRTTSFDHDLAEIFVKECAF